MHVRALLLAITLSLGSGLAVAQEGGDPKPTKPATQAPKPIPRTKNARKLRSLIRDLGSEDWATREAAREGLLGLGSESVPYLERATRDVDTERRTNAKEVLLAIRWLVPDELRRIVGDALDGFPQLPKRERLVAIRAYLPRPHEARVGIPFLLTVARFDPDSDVRQSAVRIYLKISPGPQPRFDRIALVALADEEASALVSYLRARLFGRQGKTDEAVAACEDALGRAPGSPEVLSLLVEFYLQAGKSSNALPLAQKLAKAQPTNLVAKIQVGEALVRSGERDEGLALLASVLTTTQDREGKPVLPPLPTLLRLGKAYLRSEEPEEATVVYRKALSKFPFDRQLNVAMGDVYRATGKVSDAVQVYLSEMRYAAVQPVSPEYLALKERLIEILEQGDAGWLAEEEEFFLDAHRGRPVIQARRAVGRWLQQRGLNAQAADELRIVAALDPDSAQAFSELGDALKGDRKYDEAKAAYTESLRLDPKAARPQAQLRDLAVLRARDRGDDPARSPEGFALWERRVEAATLAKATASVGSNAPPPLAIGERLVVPAPGTVDLYGLAADDGRIVWRFTPEPPPAREGELPEQIGLEPVALCTVSPGVVAATHPRRARKREPLIAALYNVYWRPVHRSWKRAKFRGLRAYLVDPERGTALAALELDRLAQGVPPAGAARRGRLLIYSSRRPKRVELELVDLVRRRPLWRAAMPKGALRRPLIIGERVFVSWRGGVAAVGSDGKSVWTHQRASGEAEEESAPLTTGLIQVNDSVVFGTGDGRLIGLSLEDGKATELARPSKKRLVGELAFAEGRLFVAERGGAVHGLLLDDEGATKSWTTPATKAAIRTLAWAGGKVFTLNGSGDDFFRSEAPVLQALDPSTGRCVFQRPVPRPAQLYSFGGLILVTSGGAKRRGGLRVLGAHPEAKVDAVATLRLELRSAAADALIEEQFEVAAIVARKFMRLRGPEKLDAAGAEFMVRVLARSNRREEALDVIHEAESQAGIKGQEHWDTIRKELGFDDEPEPEPKKLPRPPKKKADEPPKKPKPEGSL